MQPRAEHVHWLFATGFLLLALCLLARAIVGADVWDRRAWRAYLWPSLLFGLGVLMWPVMVFFTNSTIHMVAHGAWAQTMMLAGAAELGLVRGKLHNRAWQLALPLALAVSGIAILVHEQNGWLFARAAFLHHALGWTALVGATFQLLAVVQPRRRAWAAGLALTIVVLSVLLYSDRDVAPIFGHLSEQAGVPHR
ncbi:MAG: hypothetical protein ACTHOE_06235 [Conexibacter sp.]